MMGLEGFQAFGSPSFEPLTRSLLEPRRCLVVVILALSGSMRVCPFFLPVGFSWCSHTHGKRNEITSSTGERERPPAIHRGQISQRSFPHIG
jgi:hypothetical protein